MIKAIVTDIEGTTTKLSFVKDVLFPFAYQYLPNYLAEHHSEPQIATILNETRELLDNPQLTVAELTKQFLAWIEQDKKITPLKTLQGYIWKDGYDKGELVSHVYPDAIDQLKSWHQQGITLAIFSSGSILAQKLLFSHTDEGDLTPLFSGYFDTNIGAKNSPEAYLLIAQQLNFKSEDVLFLSDIEAELDAAKAAGMKTYGLMRESFIEQIHKHSIAKTFYDINPS